MRAESVSTNDLLSEGFRLDASYHANSGTKAIARLNSWKNYNPFLRKLETVGDVCDPEGIFIGGRAKRIYVEDPEHGIPFLSSSDMLLASLDGVKLISKKQPYIESSLLRQGWTLISRSGTVGNTAYVRSDMVGLAGSEHIMRVVADQNKIKPGYLYAYLSSDIGVSIIKQGTFGAVIDTIEPKYIASLPIPRLDPSQEEEIHRLIEQASELRVLANQRLQGAQDRFYRQVLELDPDNLHWRCRSEHSFGIGTANIHTGLFRMDGFHYVGYVGEGEQKLGKTIPMGNLVDPYQPSQFKRPYTGETGTPFLSGIDLFNCYPKTRIYISSKMKNLERYLVSSGTILVQCDGSRDGLIAHPTIMPHHLNNCAVTQHMARLYPKNPSDRGYVYIWLSTELGRRILLKHSSGSVMGSLFERSFLDAIIPDCSAELRYSFEPDLQSICTMREQANELEDQAQKMLLETLGIAL